MNAPIYIEKDLVLLDAVKRIKESGYPNFQDFILTQLRACRDIIIQIKAGYDMFQFPNILQNQEHSACFFIVFDAFLGLMEKGYSLIQGSCVTSWNGNGDTPYQVCLSESKCA